MAETNLRQAEAKVNVVGILSEKDLKIETKDGVTKLTGHLTLKTSDINFVRFNVNVNEITKAGSPNSVFTGLKTVMEEYKSIAEVGEENADRISVSKGDLNLYTDKNGNAAISYKSNFFNRVKDLDSYEPCAEFSVEVFITAITPEIDKEGDETGRALVKGWVPTYNGIEPITMYAGADIADAVASTFETGQTVNFWGDIVNNRVVIEREIPVRIGKPRIERDVTTKNELVITGASEAYEEGYTKEAPYEMATIKAAVQERQNRLEEEKAKAKNEQKSAGAAKPSGQKFGRSLEF